MVAKIAPLMLLVFQFVALVQLNAEPQLPLSRTFKGGTKFQQCSDPPQHDQTLFCDWTIIYPDKNNMSTEALAMQCLGSHYLQCDQTISMPHEGYAHKNKKKSNL